MEEEQDDRRTYAVVVNDEEQYSIWLAHKPCPPGWREAGVKGTKDECLRHIDEVWTDMRPLSLRRYLQEAGDA
jgi:MbtH protein